jgi:hypothetical protein
MTRIGQGIFVFVGAVIATAAAAQTPGPTIPKLSPELERQFKKADINQRGGLNKIEATSAGFAVEGSFESIDTDEDKIITLYEIGGYLADKGRQWTTADDDGDGSVSRSEASKSPSLSQIFTKADRDGDGVVRKEEHEAFSQTSLYQNVDLPYVVPNIINKKF